MFAKTVSEETVWWYVSVGHVFKRKGKHFIPVKMIGVPMSKKFEMIHYLIYLEIMQIPA